MAIPSRQIGWSTEDNLLWQISKQLEQLTNVTYNACANNAPTYKVFTALLTQSGGDNRSDANYQNQEALTIGQTYYINSNVPVSEGGTDFTNVGAPNNNVDTYFIATGTTPIWGTEDGFADYNTGTPIATVLENTIGDIWFTYEDPGAYYIYSDGLFVNDKTYVQIGNTAYNGNQDRMVTTYFFVENQNSIEIICTDLNYIHFDDVLNKTPIEIRVYN